MIKIIIIDDHMSVLESFTRFMEEDGGISVVGTGTKASDAIKLSEENGPDLALLDVCTENGENGIEIAKELKNKFPNMKVIIMSGFDEISYIPSAIDAGANAFISKGDPLPEFVETIKLVMDGGEKFPEEITIPVLEGNSPFTKRELEILRMICNFYDRKEIAEELCISTNTIKRHIENMLAKSGCKSTLELAVFVTGKGYISTHH